jgi:hypothetical protein
MTYLAGMCLLIAAFFCCTPEEEIISPDANLRLSFSADTVRFDTLFTERPSITRQLKVFNTADNAVETDIRLAGGQDSFYRVFVNGQGGTAFEDVLLRGGDSLLILVEVLIPERDEDLPFLIEDALLFATNGAEQAIRLLSWGQDAHFIRSLIIRRDTTFRSTRPFVISDSIWVQEQARLTIEAGVRLYFEPQSNLWVDGSLQVAGSPDAPVLFTNIRQDDAYANAYGQWQGVLMSELSRGHRVDYAMIRNAEVGIFLAGADADTIPDLEISNSIIENMSINGILAGNADIDAYNLKISHCMANAVGNFGNGYYRYRHCTFANDALAVSRQGPTLFFSDTLLADASISQSFSLTLINNIIWGSRNNELRLLIEQPSSAVSIRSNLVKAEAEGFPFTEENILNEPPQFSDPAVYIYTLDSTSAAINQGRPLQIERDIRGLPRDSLPDLGAYEYLQQ